MLYLAIPILIFAIFVHIWVKRTEETEQRDLEEGVDLRRRKR